jgi:hypothetical protein
MTTKQVSAVVNAVTEVLGDDFAPGTTVVSEIITDEQKEQVREIVFNGIMDGSVTFKGSTDDADAVRRYVNGMVDNHFRKSKALNGSKSYAPSSTGSKRDPQLKELGKLLKTFEPGTENYLKVQGHMEQRSAQLQAERGARATSAVRESINKDILPEHLAHMVK